MKESGVREDEKKESLLEIGYVDKEERSGRGTSVERCFRVEEFKRFLF